MKFYKSIGLLSLASAVMAFESTVPCLLWSPKNYIDTSVNAPFIVNKADATNSILSSLSSDVCSAKVIAIVNQPEIHSSDFSSSEYKGAFVELKEQNAEAVSRKQFEYITNGVDIKELSKLIADQCGATVSTLETSDISGESFDQKDKPIVSVVSLPKAEKDVEVLKKNDEILGKLIDAVKSKVQDEYVVIYTSNEVKPFQTKHVAPESKNLPIFEKYQLFSAGVFMVIGVVIVLLFIAGTGITWLVSIQTPVRFDGKQKKN